jgi:hypothetical protein
MNYVLEVAAQATAVEMQISAQRLVLESSPSVGDLLTAQEIVAMPNMTNNVLELVSVMGKLLCQMEFCCKQRLHLFRNGALIQRRHEMTSSPLYAGS